ncbi:MAG TPA: hypothetical protein VG961_00185 [Ignavibacteria bacterium]|nr:hypothetical protein [Ignavibacteria bacterium]
METREFSAIIAEVKELLKLSEKKSLELAAAKAKLEHMNRTQS